MLSSRDPVKKKAPKDSLTLLPCFYFVELPIVASSMVSLYFLELTDVLQPAQVGFRCHDRALSMPYVDGGDELIPLLMLLSLAFAGPAASIMLGEGLIYCMQSRLKIRRGAEGSINAGGCNFNSFLRRTVRFVGVHVFGLCATALLTDVIQLSTGYHAPFFLTVCRPNYTLAPLSCDQNPYITKDICAGPDHNAILAARKTFPSQHATLSAFAAVYISMYFNSTISDSTKLLKPVLVFAFSMVAALTGLTQITQYRSHPADVYVGFLIGGFIAAYLAFHAVANFKSSEDFPPAPAPPPPKEDPLRALTQRGHDSVYNKGPASASDSNDEITVGTTASARSPQAPMERLEGLVHGRPSLQREKDSMETLKRASVDVELLAPRSPMGKEMMVTFSNTLPRASINVNGMLGGADLGEEPPHLSHPAQPVQRRLKAVQVPMDPLRAQQLVSEWKQKSMEMRGVEQRSMDMRGVEQRSMDMRGGVEVEVEASEEGSEVGSSSLGTDDGGGSSLSSQVPVYPPTVQPARRSATPPANAQQQPGGGARAVATPRPPQIPEAGPPPVSPKSALTRAKWLAITEKTGAGRGAGGGGQATNQPRLMQVIAMSKQQGLLPSSSTDTPKSSETTSSPSSSSGGGGGGRTSPAYVTVDAHGHAHHHAHHHHHPVVQAPPPPPPPHHSVTPPPLSSSPSPSATNGNPWEWRGPPANGSGEGGGGGGDRERDRDPRDTYDLNTHSRGDSAARGSSFRPHSQPSFHHHHHHGSGSPELELQLPPPPLLPPQHGGGGVESAGGGGGDAPSVQQQHHHHHHHQRSASREASSVRRKTALVLLDRELEQDSYYKKAHAGRRYNN